MVNRNGISIVMGMMRRKLKILLVEDDKIDVLTLKRAFKKNNYDDQIFVCKNGEDALKFLRHEGKYSEDNKYYRPDIILLDLNMPIMNGLEFLEIIKSDSDLKTIPIIVLTTSRNDNDRIESYKQSVAGYIIKPVEFKSFMNVVKNIKEYWGLCESVPEIAS
ncbi:MAG: response regulator [Candidatus Helarchaeota archaeon]